MRWCGYIWRFKGAREALTKRKLEPLRLAKADAKGIGTILLSNLKQFLSDVIKRLVPRDLLPLALTPRTNTLLGVLEPAGGGGCASSGTTADRCRLDRTSMDTTRKVRGYASTPLITGTSSSSYTDRTALSMGRRW